MHRAERFFQVLVISLLIILFSSRSQVYPGNELERVRAYTRMIEFDYVTWTLDAVMGKTTQGALGASRYISSDSAKSTVLEYLQVVERSQFLEWEIESIFSDPQVADPEVEAAEKLKQLQSIQIERQELAALAESILQAQISQIVTELEIGSLGQPLPPLLFHVTELPLSLVVSPREVIRQDANISLLPDLDLDEIIQLEKEVEEGLNVSTLVTRIGGVGVYPTMVAQSTSLPWLTETVAHEWIHNYLTLHPLGIRYDTSAELRTMNETTASIAGKEIGIAVLETYYPEFVPEPVELVDPENNPTPEPLPQAFDFNTEMRLTRETADALLEEGKVEEAEAYMEERRIVFWNQGYQIRKLNQAYFAFHGAYADVPGGAAGEDPVGASVRNLRAESQNLAAFLKTMAAMTSFEDLQKALQ